MKKQIHLGQNERRWGCRFKTCVLVIFHRTVAVRFATERCKRPVWLQVGSLWHLWLFKRHFSFVAVKKCFFFFLQDLWVFKLLESKFWTIWKLFKLITEQQNNIKTQSFGLTYWLFFPLRMPFTHRPAPQSANCAGKSTDLRNTSTGSLYYCLNIRKTMWDKCASVCKNGHIYQLKQCVQ